MRFSTAFGGLIVSMLVLSAVYQTIESRSGHTNDYKLVFAADFSVFGEILFQKWWSVMI